MCEDIYLKKIIFKNIVMGLLFALLCVIVQQSSALLAYIAAKPIMFFALREDPNRFVADISGLKPGKYYVSIGRPRGVCELRIDGQLLSTNRGVTEGVRDSLLLGASINKTNEQKLDLICDKQRGFSAEFTHQPIVAERNIGILIQLLRALTELVIGPVSSFIIIFTYFFTKKIKPADILDKEANSFLGAKYLFFGVSTLFYALSLSFYTRLFLNSFTASFLHIILRYCYGLSFLILFSNFSKFRRVLIFFYIAMIFSLLAVGLNYPENLIGLYKNTYIFFPLSIVLLITDTSVDFKNRFILLQHRILIAWFVIQFADLCALSLGLGAFSAPVVVMFLSISAVYVRDLYKTKYIRFEKNSKKVLSIIESNLQISDILKQISLSLLQEFEFSRVSVYLDSYVMGHSELPESNFVRLFEQGYLKNTEMDNMISFPEGRGLIMRQALDSKVPVLKKGVKDDCWFLIVPIGSQACLNFSNMRPGFELKAFDSEENAKNLLPVLDTLKSKIIDLTVKQSFALERLRVVYGSGNFDINLGTLFCDINNYSDFSARYGEEFNEFISSVYFQSLIKLLAPYAVPEYLKGDEICFVVIQDLLSEGLTVESALVQATKAFYSFVNNEGAQLCRSSGFEPITFSAGVSMGPATLVCDPVKVRVTGPVLIEAKRLLEAAPSQKILIKSEVAEELFKKGFELKSSEEFPILVKKNFIMARTLVA